MADNLIIAKNVEEAVALKDGSSLFLAGGTEVNRLDSPCCASTLISLGRMGLDGLSVCEETVDCCKGPKKGRFLKLGAMCTFQELIDCEDVPQFLKEACRFMSSRTKRNMATIGGNIGAARDDSYLIPTLIAASCAVELNCKGKKHVYGIGRYLKEKKDYPDSLIEAVLIPLNGAEVLSKRYANTAASHAAVTVSVSLLDGKVRVGAAVKNAGVRRLVEFEELINAGKGTEEELIKAAYGLDMPISDDMFGSEKYKRYILGVTVSDLVKKAQGGKK
ncbi:MAG: FAD binding domain-containing protein [Sphaerochaetaceae bacterium]|nr:FAD binding domain-containing protein [Sphaerochaetaceae bacterium]